MAIEITWDVVTVDYATDASTGLPTENLAIHWRCSGIDGALRATSVGVASIPPDHPARDPATLTDDAAVLTQLYTIIDQTAIESGITDDIAAQSAPVTQSGKYWDYPADTRIWAVGIEVAVDDILVYEGVTYITIQAHTTQADWPPPVVPALFSVYRPPDGPADPEWVAGEAVEVDDRRTYEGILYEVIQAHTTQVGWEPPNVPALWRAV